MAVKLKGKITLVTGADRGIGRGIVEVFAEEGADVAVNYIEEPEKAEAVAQCVREKRASLDHRERRRGASGRR